MSDTERLRRRLDRERAARREAEAIAEETTRALFDRQQELILLESVAVASNESEGVVEAMQVALERVCGYLNWPVGHGWLVEDRGEAMLPCGVSYVSDRARFGTFAAESAGWTFAAGEGLPGRVLASGRAAWIEDVVVDPNFPRAAAAASVGLHGAVAFPVIVAGEPAAVLECFTDSPYRPAPEMVRVLEQAGRQLARVFDRARTEAELLHQASHDSLTELPNRVLFNDRLDQALAYARRQDSSRTAVLLLDLDRFKEVNDTLGHHQGDRLLREVGDRLRGTLREADTIARLGGDEFALILPLVDDEAAAVRAAERLRAALAEPISLDGVQVQVDASIGIALYPDHGEDRETLVRQADVGMYEAKRTHAGHMVYAAEHDPYSPRRLGMVAALRAALEAGRLILHYQPKVSVGSGEVRGVEALVRWPDPERGLVPPAEFIPLAESTGLIKPLTVFVLRAALAQARLWLDGGLEVPVAVNLAARSLLDVGFPDRVAELLKEARVAPALLELEVTETMMLEDPTRSLEVLTRLDAMGIALSIDDFGTGYSSLAQLKRLPVRSLKIDRGFVASMCSDDRDAFIVRSSIQLGHNLGLTVVGEGVEDSATLVALGSLGCDNAQGYLIKRPCPADELTPWLQAESRHGSRAA
jgi:diguanylate cyclase (GGDEF)-like protein